MTKWQIEYLRRASIANVRRWHGNLNLANEDNTDVSKGKVIGKTAAMMPVKTSGVRAVQTRADKIQAALFEIQRSRAAFALLGRVLDAIDREDLREIDTKEVKAGVNRIYALERKLIASLRKVERIEQLKLKGDV